nr:helix-turn-helix domain-containing protein [Paremcibacter congregatus]|tara:strand:+ start:729 stop:1133 length:405 start_codon:yes stop_codon:yes gene_type:complete
MMDIAQVAKQSGLPASTLRYYEEKGLIQSIGRRGLRRLFDRDILDRLSLVALGRNAGFSLEEIAQMFGPRGALHIDRDQLSRKAEEIDHSIHRLMAMRDGLRHAAKCPATHHLECPTFRRIVAVTRKRGARGKR